MKMERNSKGEVRINGEKIATIPGDKSMFSMGSLVNGGDYTVDQNWIYVDDKPVRKQFHNSFGFSTDGHEAVRVWLPNVEDLKALEHRYWEKIQSEKKYFDKVWTPAFDDVVRVGEAHAQITHKYNGDGPGWWLYEGDKNGISFKWCKEVPKKPKNLEIGLKWYKVDEYAKSVWTRGRKFRIALESRFITELDKRTGSSHGYLNDPIKNKLWNRQVCFEINGRHYWFHPALNRYGAYRWEVLSWPTKEVKIVKIK